MDRLDHGHFAGLDDLGFATGDDFALGTGNHINLAQASPEYGKREERHDRPFDVARQRVDGLLLKRQGRRQELYFVRQARRCLHRLAVVPGLRPGPPVTLQQFTPGVHAASPCCRRYNRE